MNINLFKQLLGHAPAAQKRREQSETTSDAFFDRSSTFDAPISRVRIEAGERPRLLSRGSAQVWAGPQVRLPGDLAKLALADEPMDSEVI